MHWSTLCSQKDVYLLGEVSSLFRVTELRTANKKSYPTWLDIWHSYSPCSSKYFFMWLSVLQTLRASFLHMDPANFSGVKVVKESCTVLWQTEMGALKPGKEDGDTNTHRDSLDLGKKHIKNQLRGWGCGSVEGLAPCTCEVLGLILSTT